MKRVVIILLALLLCVISVFALAASYTESGCGVCKSFVCNSSRCKGVHQNFVCVSHYVTTATVECPDNIVNCICTKKMIRHTYSCTCSASKKYVTTVTYDHSK